MGMGKTGIPWVPWDSHGNGNKVSHGMGMGWEWEVSAWEWELRRGNGKKLRTVNSKHLQSVLVLAFLHNLRPIRYDHYNCLKFNRQFLIYGPSLVFYPIIYGHSSP